MVLNEQDLYESTVLWHIPFWQTTLFYRIVLAAGIALLIITLFFCIKKIKNKQKKPLTPVKKAWHDLMQLEKDNKKQSLHANEFYSNLTLILKQLISQVYAIPISLTDSELIQYLSDKQFSDSLIGDLEAVFNGSLLVKFAQGSALQDQINCDFKVAKEFIMKIEQATNSK